VVQSRPGWSAPSPGPGRGDGFRHVRTAICFLVILTLKALTVAAPLAAQQPSPPAGIGGWSLQVRSGFVGERLEPVDLPVETRTTGAVRLQLRGIWTPIDRVTLRAGLAGRFTLDDDRAEFIFERSAPTTTGLRAGQATFHDLNVEFRPRRRWSVRAGRMQTGEGLVGTVSKSLDRNDSPSFGVTWTDGVEILRRSRYEWRSRLVVQHHPSGARVNGVHAPLQPGGSGASWGAHASFGRTWIGRTHTGPAQFGVGLSLLPSCIPGTHTPDGERATYLALTSRGAYRIAVGDDGAHLLVGGAAGWAPDTQLRPDGSRADGSAVQGSLNWIEAGGEHQVGLLVTRLGDGWLVSQDFRADNREIEARYRHALGPGRSAEVRLRERRGIHDPTGAGAVRVDRDFFVRFTLQGGGVIR
jgi:hypothetical protein